MHKIYSNFFFKSNIKNTLWNIITVNFFFQCNYNYYSWPQCNKNGDIFNSLFLDILQPWTFPVYQQGFLAPRKLSNTQNHKNYARFVTIFCQVCKFLSTDKWSLYLLWRTGARKGGKGKEKGKTTIKKKFIHKRKVVFELNNILLNYWYHIYPNGMWNLSKYIFSVLSWMLFLCYKFQLA